MNPIPAKVTPLWIVAAFVTLTEVVLGYALTKVIGNIQITLLVFVIVFALLVAGAFFIILWNRPYVFYPPSEYGSIDPKVFVTALRPEIPTKVAEQVQLAVSVGKDPGDTNAQFKLIDSMLDQVHRQFLIFMHEVKSELPYAEFWNPLYEMEYAQGAGASGGFNGRDFVNNLEGTGFITLLVKGPTISLTKTGHDFAKWLIDNGGKAAFFRMELDGWGEPLSDGPIFKMRKHRDETQTRAIKTVIPPTRPK